jgi:uncharacterized protein (TIGR02646 family)
MQPISQTNLAPDLSQHLAQEQAKINQENSFQDKVDKAKSLWNAKSNSNQKEAIFSDIYDALANMCISHRICNYCEANEADDIEHIYPKSFFPERTFLWDNYLLACKSCNTHWKLDKCYILNDCNSTALSRGTEPPLNSELAFINPRTEDPNDFLFYDTLTHVFIANPLKECQNVEKAERTIEILGLNARHALIHSRKEAYKSFYDKLSLLQKAKQATTHVALEACFYPDGAHFVDYTQPIESQIAHFEASIGRSIQNSRHQSVWYAIKTHCKNQPKWRNIFEAIPIALTW